MVLHDGLHDGQAEPGPRDDLPGGLGAPDEPAEDGLLLVDGDADPVVDHRQDHRRRGRRDVHEDVPAGRRELDGVADQVEQQALELVLVAEDQDRFPVVRAVSVRRLGLGGGQERLADRVDQRVDVDGHQVDVVDGGIEVREGQDVLDQHRQADAVLLDDLEHPVLVAADAVLVPEELGVGADGREGVRSSWEKVDRNSLLARSRSWSWRTSSSCAGVEVGLHDGPTEVGARPSR